VPTAPLSQVKAATALPPFDRLTLLQCFAETALEAHPVKVLT